MTQSLWKMLFGVLKKHCCHKKCCGCVDVLQCSKAVAKCGLHQTVKVACNSVAI